MNGFRILSLLGSLVLLTGCSAEKPAPPAQTEAQAAEPPPLTTVTTDRTDLLFRFRSEDGYQTTTQISEIPQQARGQVHVIDLSRSPQERANGWAQIFDLSKDGAFEGRQVRRSQLEAALKEAYDAKPKAPQVIMYSTEYCGVCKKAARFMTQNGIAFVDKDIEKDKGARREMLEKARTAGVQANGVPVFDIGGKIKPGFDPGTLLKMVGKAPKAPM